MSDEWSVILYATKAGSLHANNGERRTYTVTAETRDAAEEIARVQAYDEGLEHTHVIRCTRIVREA